MNTAAVLGISGAGLALYLASRKPAAGSGSGGLHTLPPAAPPTVTRWRDDALDAGRVYGVSPQLILAVIWQESTGVPTAVGSAGEVGLMQLKDVAAVDAGFNSAPADGRSNIYVGTAFLALQIERMGNVFDGLRAYNAGETGARRNLNNGAAYAESVLRRAGWQI